MTDFLNQTKPVSDPSFDGLYSWMSIRAGGNNNTFRNLKLKRPLNNGGSFSYNLVDIPSASLLKYNNTIITPTGALNTQVIPNTVGGNGVIVEVGGGSLSVDPSLLEFTNSSGSSMVIECYFRVLCRSSSLQGSGDVIELGVSRAGAQPTVNNRVTLPINALNGNVVEFTGTLLLTAYGIGEILQLVFQNTTTAARGITVTDMNFIISKH